MTPELDPQTVHRAGASTDGDRVRTDDSTVDVELAVAGEAEARDGATSPEHLMAAALAGCFQQALGIASSAIDGGGGPASVEATVTLRSGDGGGYTATYELVVHGLDGDESEHVLTEAKALCPFTKSLAGDALTISLG